MLLLCELKRMRRILGLGSVLRLVGMSWFFLMWKMFFMKFLVMRFLVFD